MPVWLCTYQLKLMHGHELVHLHDGMILLLILHPHQEPCPRAKVCQHLRGPLQTIERPPYPKVDQQLRCTPSAGMECVRQPTRWLPTNGAKCRHQWYPLQAYAGIGAAVSPKIRSWPPPKHPRKDPRPTTIPMTTNPSYEYHGAKSL
jgi:hypothetical protein